MKFGVRVPSEFSVHTALEIVLENRSQTKTHIRQFKRVSGKACRAQLNAARLQARAVDAAPRNGASNLMRRGELHDAP